MRSIISESVGLFVYIELADKGTQHAHTGRGVGLSYAIYLFYASIKIKYDESKKIIEPT